MQAHQCKQNKLFPKYINAQSFLGTVWKLFRRLWETVEDGCCYPTTNTKVIIDYGDDLILCSLYYTIYTVYTIASLCVNKKECHFDIFNGCECIAQQWRIKKERKESNRNFPFQDETCTQTNNSKSQRYNHFWFGCISTNIVSFFAFVKIHLEFWLKSNFRLSIFSPSFYRFKFTFVSFFIQSPLISCAAALYIHFISFDLLGLAWHRCPSLPVQRTFSLHSLATRVFWLYLLSDIMTSNLVINQILIVLFVAVNIAHNHTHTSWGTPVLRDTTFYIFIYALENDVGQKISTFHRKKEREREREGERKQQQQSGTRETLETKSNHDFF